MDLSYKNLDYVDTSKLDDAMLKENYIFALGFPTHQSTQYVPLRVVGRERLMWWEYDPIQEGMFSNDGTNIVGGKVVASTSTDGITNHTVVTAQRPSSQYASGKPYFIFPNDTKGKYGNLYQLFLGVSPSFMQVTLEQPQGTRQMVLPVQTPNSSYNQFGFIPGSQTPIEKPDPISELFVPPSLQFALGLVNPVNESAKPLFLWVVNYIKYEVIQNADLAYELMNTTKYKSLKLVGGSTAYQYDVRANFGVNPITLGMTRQDIAKALGVA